MSDDPSLADRLDRVEADLRALRSELRTRRVVVVDDGGVERVVLSAERRTGSILARVERTPGRTVGIELYATEPEGEAPIVGVAELRDGDVVGERGG